jgi:NAD(P)-dependent dehydrogenase (short-subunit alcohol dehydrogenase family)
MQALKGKIIIVTGGNSGIGYFGIKKFLSLGATVVMASRDESRAKKAMSTFDENDQKRVHFIPLDLMSLASVDQFAKTFKANFKRLDVLINNAGIMFGDYHATEDGFESQMATNHFGHLALTSKLFDLIVENKGRIVNISSIAHRRGIIDFDNLNYQRKGSYSPWAAYSRSKLCNLLFSFSLHQAAIEHKLPITVVTAHPGVSKTNLLFKNASTQPFYNLLKFIMPLQSAEQGALPLIDAALNPSYKGGEYVGPNGWFEFSGKPKLVKSIPLAKDEKTASRLLAVSCQLTNVSFPFLG